MVARASEVERLLGESRLGDETCARKIRVKGRAQRMTENGEALKYIESVLRQLRRASRDHRQLVEQRHRVDVSRSVRVSSTSREHPEKMDPRSFVIPAEHEPFEEDRLVRDSWETPRGEHGWREIGSIEEPREMTEYSVLDIATKLLARRKSYARAMDRLETTPKRIHERTSLTSRHELRYVPAYQGIDTTIIQWTTAYLRAICEETWIVKVSRKKKNWIAVVGDSTDMETGESAGKSKETPYLSVVGRTSSRLRFATCGIPF